uniref:Uncharacterized protein n=1 Tax=Octopus bimaculoides TaxID=37653 RepID=A0A0L8HCH0_OCTBM
MNWQKTRKKTVVEFRENKVLHKFDPTKNIHLWTMWRVAINDKLVEHFGNTKYSYQDYFGTLPFRGYIHLTQHSLERLKYFDNRILDPEQFIYYGLPRVRPYR